MKISGGEYEVLEVWGRDKPKRLYPLYFLIDDSRGRILFIDSNREQVLLLGKKKQKMR